MHCTQLGPAASASAAERERHLDLLTVATAEVGLSSLARRAVALVTLVVLGDGAPAAWQEEKLAKKLLKLCVQQLGGADVVPIFAMLAHRWLLSSPTAGEEEWRIKHIRIMLKGRAHLLYGMHYLHANFSSCRTGYGNGHQVAAGHSER